MGKQRPVVQATNRLAGFNAQRDEILAEVRRRVVESCVRAAHRGGDDSLEYVLNDAAYCEIHRLEGTSDRAHQRRLHAWRDLAGRLTRMSEAEKRAELDELVQHYSRDVVGNFDPRVFRVANDVLPPALSFLLSRVGSVREGVAALAETAGQVQVEGPLDQLRRLFERGTVVVTPTHSSNLDSIILGYGLNRTRLPPVTYGAGKNLFTNPFISFFMRNLGAYRVDRRLRFRLYKDVLKEYSTVLLERGFHSLFFPGGTRSRSNEIEQSLKLGLLGTAVTAYRNHVRAGRPERRLYIAPVTINYRLVLEAETLIEDYLAETGKSRYIIADDEFSRLGRILEFARKTLVHDAAIVLRFGVPLDPFGNRVDDDGGSLDARGRPLDPARYFVGAGGDATCDDQRDAEYTRSAGRALARAFRAETVVQPTQLVARALLNAIAERAGTRDIYRLLRLPATACEAPLSAIADRVATLRRQIADDAALGVIPRRMASLPVDGIVDEALLSLGTYHTRPVALRSRDHIRVGDIKLLFYYQNRLSHVPTDGAGAASRGAGS